MNNLSSRLVVYLVGGAAFFVILFGISRIGFHYQSDLAGCRDYDHGSADPQPLIEAGYARLVIAGANHPAGCADLGAGHRDGFLFNYQAVHRAAGLHDERFAASQRRPIRDSGCGDERRGRAGDHIHGSNRAERAGECG